MSKLNHTVGTKLVATLALPIASVVAIAIAPPANAMSTPAVRAATVPPVHVAAQPLDKPVHATFKGHSYCIAPILTINQWLNPDIMTGELPNILTGELPLDKCSGRSSSVLE